MPWHAYAFIEHVLHVMGLRSLKTFVFSILISHKVKSLQVLHGSIQGSRIFLTISHKISPF
jgi:hypothetical protein